MFAEEKDFIIVGANLVSKNAWDGVRGKTHKITDKMRIRAKLLGYTWEKEWTYSKKLRRYEYKYV